MYDDEAIRLNDYATRLKELRTCLDVDGTKKDIAEIERQMSASNFWDDPESAQKVVQRLKVLKGIVSAPDALEREIADAQMLLELAQSEADESLGAELAALDAQLG